MTGRAVLNVGSESDSLAGHALHLRFLFATCAILISDALVYRDGDGPGWKAA